MFLSQHYRWLMSDFVDAERLLGVSQVRGHVVSNHVNFSYVPRRQAVIDLNISAEPGEAIAIVGVTGAGKSSVFKLLLRFSGVSSGRIEIDDQDLREVTLGSIREATGVVPQVSILFEASIMENVRYALPTTTDEEVFTAYRAAATIHDKILTFPKRYGTNVGENGVKLSGGEVQRFAIARVFLEDPAILVLDETTSAVDTCTESEVQDALDRVKKKRTTFVIAHRLSTVVAADQILVMHEGRIVERGTHEELLKLESRYRTLRPSLVHPLL
ncbi:hypothetical protein BBP40_003480 [Aspergillus hancockii]|nr:hypothetical protein BBP40_003480 [Aspergillus hancockii]